MKNILFGIATFVLLMFLGIIMLFAKDEEYDPCPEQSDKKVEL